MIVPVSRYFIEYSVNLEFVFSSFKIQVVPVYHRKAPLRRCLFFIFLTFAAEVEKLHKGMDIQYWRSSINNSVRDHTTAMLTTFNEVDMKPIMDLRTKYKNKFKEEKGVGLGFMGFFTKAWICPLRLNLGEDLNLEL